MMTGIDSEYPAALALLPLIPVLFRFRNRFRMPTQYSSVDRIEASARPHWLKRHLADTLAALFLLLGILSVADFRYAIESHLRYLESKWIMIVQDLSGSMNRPSGVAPDQTLGDVSLKAVETFIDMRHPDDLIGVIAFSSHAKLVAPPTFDRRILRERLALLRRRSDSAIFREMTAGGATNASYATWLALSTFFMLMPEDRRPSYPELKSLRHALSGGTDRHIELPDRLDDDHSGRGMAVVVFTDGRIEADNRPEDAQAGLPSFINVIRLLRRLDIRLYLIVVGQEIDPGVREAMLPSDGAPAAGLIFHTPARVDRDTITEAYAAIHRLEKNRLLYERVQRHKSTRKGLSIAATVCLIAYGGVICSRRLARI